MAGDGLEKASNFLLLPVSIIMGAVWLGVFSYLQVASIETATKAALMGYLLRTLASQVMIFMAALIPMVTSFIIEELSASWAQRFKVFSFWAMLLLLVSTPAPLATILSVVNKAPEIYDIYLGLGGVVILFFGVVPTVARWWKRRRIGA